MMGCLLSRALLLTFGYAYPAYKCFKIVETKTPQVDQLLFWCQYWIIVAFVTALERIGDVSLSWLPLYGEAKLVFFIYLWHQETKGTVFIYNRVFVDYLSKHETKIDMKLMEIKAVLMNIAVLLWHKVIGYGLVRFYDICQGFGSQLLPDHCTSGQEKDKITIGPESRPKPDEVCDTLKGRTRTKVTSHDSTSLGNIRTRWSGFRYLKQRMSCCGIIKRS